MEVKELLEKSALKKPGEIVKIFFSTAFFRNLLQSLIFCLNHRYLANGVWTYSYLIKSFMKVG